MREHHYFWYFNNQPDQYYNTCSRSFLKPTDRRIENSGCPPRWISPGLASSSSGGRRPLGPRASGLAAAAGCGDAAAAVAGGPWWKCWADGTMGKKPWENSGKCRIQATELGDFNGFYMIWSWFDHDLNGTYSGFQATEMVIEWGFTGKRTEHPWFQLRKMIYEWWVFQIYVSLP